MDNTTDVAPDKQPLPTILQDDHPLEGGFTTTLSFESGLTSTLGTGDFGHPSGPTDTLSSFSSTHSSGGNNNTLSTWSSTASGSSRRGSMQFAKHVEVKETLNASVSENADGFLQLKQYVLKGEIGKGAFGKVHYAVDDTTKTEYAVKEFSKFKLRKKDKANLFKLGPRGRGRGRRGPEAPSPVSTESSPLDLIRGEVAILKKLNHPNIVKLYEVLDIADGDSMYMVFEWCEKGVLMPVTLTTEYESLFTDAECRDIFQQIVLGIEYLHEHDIVHRDIKPDNLLRSADGTVKIVDFGVSEMFDKKGNDMTRKPAGSPAFMAPELCKVDHGEVSGKATDVWSIGVTLYCLRYGRLPYVSESIYEMQRVIREEEFVVPETEKDPRFITLINRLLEKDPVKRITIDELRDDPWLTNNGTETMITKEENTEHAVTEVTEQDLKDAIHKVNSLITVIKAVTRLKRGIKSRAAAATAAVITEKEKMEDADEGVPKTKEISSQPKTDTEAVIAAAVEKVESELSRVSLADATSPDTTPDATTQDQQEGKTEPEGYQVCDMETGMCYWVPAKKAQSADQDGKDEGTTTSAGDTLQVPVALEEQETKAPALAPPSTSSPSLSPSPSPKLGPYSTALNSSTGSLSSGQPAGPARVGKLSRDRLAMFEKST